MDSTIWGWLIVLVWLFVAFGSPVLGIIRGVANSSILNSVLSVFIPLYGMIYFFAARRRMDAIARRMAGAQR
jgi:hypothetical protein